jgi:hypothetical protein
MLKLITILVCEAEGSVKLPLITSNDKELFLSTITDLVRISFEVIPQNLQNVDTSSLLYADGLKNAAQDFLDQLKHLELSKIKKTIEETEVSSKEIRYKLMLESKKSDYLKKIDLKNDYFKKKESEEHIETLPQVFEDKLQDSNEKENHLDSKNQEKSENPELLCEKIQENNSPVEKNPDETGLDLKSFLEKIPNDHQVDFTFSEESHSIVINEESVNLSKKEEKKSPEDPCKEKINDSVKTPEPEDPPRRLSAVELYIQKCRETKKNPENDEKSDSKIPYKSNIMTRIKSVTAISRSEGRSNTENSKTTQIKSPKSTHPSKLLSPKELENHSASRGELNLADSELLRSRVSKKSDGKILVSDMKKEEKHERQVSFEEKKGKTEEHKQEEKKESKIGGIKEKSHQDEHDLKLSVGKKDSKIGTIKNKK